MRSHAFTSYMYSIYVIPRQFEITFPVRLFCLFALYFTRNALNSPHNMGDISVITM